VQKASGANFCFQKRLTLACELAGASVGRLLDCAAGTGEITCALLKSGRVSHATVVDISPVMLQGANELLKRANHQRGARICPFGRVHLQAIRFQF
jgi:ubiquinone/menaquinone biosynthesis C-methylase UbiE